MARKCKCKICKKELTTDSAFKVVISNANAYFCNEEEYNNMVKEKEKKQLMQKTLHDVMGYDSKQILPPVVIKFLNEMVVLYGVDIVNTCINENVKSIEWACKSKDFSNDFSKAKYIVTILQGHINDVYEKEKLKEKQKREHRLESYVDDFDVDVLENIKPTKKKVTDLSKFGL